VHDLSLFCAYVLIYSRDFPSGLASAVSSLRQHGSSLLSVFVFALAERKNENNESVKYRSAEG